MKYKHFKAPDAVAQGFVKQLDSVDVDLQDADRDALVESTYAEFFGGLHFIVYDLYAFCLEYHKLQLCLFILF